MNRTFREREIREIDERDTVIPTAIQVVNSEKEEEIARSYIEENL